MLVVQISLIQKDVHFVAADPACNSTQDKWLCTDCARGELHLLALKTNGYVLTVLVVNFIFIQYLWLVKATAVDDVSPLVRIHNGLHQRYQCEQRQLMWQKFVPQELQSAIQKRIPDCPFVVLWHCWRWCCCDRSVCLQSGLFLCIPLCDGAVVVCLVLCWVFLVSWIVQGKENRYCCTNICTGQIYARRMMTRVIGPLGVHT